MELGHIGTWGRVQFTVRTDRIAGNETVFERFIAESHSRGILQRLMLQKSHGNPLRFCIASF